MVHIVDEGGEFDAPIETIWKFLNSPEDHGASHVEHKNAEAKPVAESMMQVSWEQDMNGKNVKVVNRVTAIAPVGLAIEMIEGPMAGSKFFNYYTPKGNKTAVTIVGDFVMQGMPAAQVEQMARKNFAHVFEQDTAALKKFQGHK